MHICSGTEGGRWEINMAYKVIDLSIMGWQQSIGNLGANGCYLKTRIKEPDGVYYYKLSAFNSAVGFYGHESINEVIVYRLCKILGIPCTEFKLVKVRVKLGGILYETYACKSKSYKKESEIAISLEDLYLETRRKNETILEFIRRNKLNSILDYMLVLDYLILNRDRHGANIEIIKGKDGKLRPATFFDNGLSFICTITPEFPNYKQSIEGFNELIDLPVNNYIGSRSLQYNLQYITNPVIVNKLVKRDKSRLFYNMRGILSEEYKDKIWAIITLRYSYLRKLGLIKER